jgi:hypothetical protein
VARLPLTRRAQARLGVGVAAVATWVAFLGAAQDPFDTFFDAERHPAIIGTGTAAGDQLSRLSRDLDEGRTRLIYDERLGYLPSLLQALAIPVESQIAVFSKTSLQASLISPGSPRAIYFNDRTIVAWPRGGFIEVAAQDARQGIAFYTLDQRRGAAPRFSRPAECLNCHSGYATLNVPGVLVRSVGTTRTGVIAPQAWNSTTTHRSPFNERWAGWYVTGHSGGLAHLGNAIVETTAAGEAVAPAPTSLDSLAPRLNVSPYLTPHSDIAALLVFDHQMHAMNLLTRTAWEVRVAAADRIPTLAAVIERSAVALVDYFLFVGEAPLTAGVRGSTDFASVFERDGPRDRQGRSLKQLDLRTRLLRYPCSYMIYTEAFDALPEALRDAVYRRLSRVLSGGVRGAAYAHLSTADRRAITEILIETKAAASEYFEQPIP